MRQGVGMEEWSLGTKHTRASQGQTLLESFVSWLLCWGSDLTLQLLSAILITSKDFLLPGRQDRGERES